MQTFWLGAGLFCATLATLLLETLNARLLSVLTWYHLSFFAVSVAMLGMAAGAVYVFLRPDAFSAERAPRSLARVTFLFAASIPLTHVASLTVPFLPLTSVNTMEVLSVAVFTVLVGIPFTLSGVAVTTALTRCGGPIGRLYAWDLIGASLGCLLVVPVLEWTNVSSAIFVAGAVAAAAAFCFNRFAGATEGGRSAVAAVLLLAAAVLNTGDWQALQVIYPKNRQLWLTTDANAIARWNSHSYVVVHRPGPSPAFLWGPGKGGESFQTRIAWLTIDGEAGTPITEWDGDPASLEWVSYDVTTLPYFLRRGDVAVIGVGGGRDLLAALWGRNRTIVGIDVNRIMIDLLADSHRAFANIAPRPEVRLVHDDGRAYLTRTGERFDIIQMSLVDTWASTGAGAFTLSENSLYTLDGWRVFLDRLKPGGILSVSRWFDPTNVSEASRLLALGVAALIDRGVASPRDHLALVVRDRVATLMVSTAPLTAADRETLDLASAPREFGIVVSPWAQPTGTALLDRIAASRTAADLERATADPLFDYTPPTDARPYYFNMLKPRAFFASGPRPTTGALGGNLRATFMLIVLLGVATVLVALIILWPLVKAGRPPMPAGRFALAMSYFAVIGAGYMLIQIGMLQRFSTYIGHPTYTLAIVLFSMLLFTGIGSFASDRILGPAPRTRRWIPVAIAAALSATALLLPPVLTATVTAGLLVRTLCVLLFTSTLSLLLGLCFPMGVRLISDRPTVVAWAWGVNGACGVLASIVAVGVSIWIGIDANFWGAAGLYLLLLVPLATLAPTRRQ
jgi:hypothetical protein